MSDVPKSRIYGHRDIKPTICPGDMLYAVCSVWSRTDDPTTHYVANGWTIAKSRNAAIARHCQATPRQVPGLRSCLLAQAVEAAEYAPTPG